MTLYHLFHQSKDFRDYLIERGDLWGIILLVLEPIYSGLDDVSELHFHLALLFMMISEPGLIDKLGVTLAETPSWCRDLYIKSISQAEIVLIVLLTTLQRDVELNQVRLFRYPISHPTARTSDHPLARDE